MKKNFYQKKFVYNEQEIIIESQEIANQAEQSFVVRWNKSVILVTLGVSKEKKDCDFLPLTVEFKENFSSVGKIPGGFFRREGKPSEYAILSARIIDRSIRPLFPKNLRNDVQIIINPLAVDYSLDIRVIAILATSLVLNTSSLPFEIPIAAVHIGLIDGEIVFNSTPENIRTSELNLFVVGTTDKINMIEVDANQISQEKLLEALKLAQTEINKMIEVQKTVINEVGKKVVNCEQFIPNSKINDLILKNFKNDLSEILEISDNRNREQALDQIVKKIKLDLHSSYELNFANELTLNDWNIQLKYHIDQFLKQTVRNNIVKKQRIDQRKIDEVRSINCKIDYLPIVHGSAIFNRGQTQTLSTITLGSISENQIVDNLTKENKKYFMHHYNSSPFSIGIVAPMRGVSRREIGHGFLGEKALKRILPSQDEFPYTVRIVTEVLQSNGSTSQAAICSSVLALLSAGVPIKNNIAGIAMGLVKSNDDYHILSDIQAWEDFYGDMDFKIAGNEKGICAIQLDLKIDGLPIDIIEKILQQAKMGIKTILTIMNKSINVSRNNLSEHALKFAKFKIDQQNISTLIGPSGKMIKKIINDTENSDINIEEDGTVLIYNKNLLMIEKAKRIIENMFKTVELNEIYNANVVKVVDFGTFVQIDNSSIQGLIHVSKLSKKFIKNVADFIKVGDKVEVKVIKIDRQKRQINFELIKKLNIKNEK